MSVTPTVGGPGVSAIGPGQVEQPCRGCGRPTGVLVWGYPGHWGCIGERVNAVRDRLLGVAPAGIDVEGLRFLSDLQGDCKPPRANYPGEDGKPELRPVFWRPPVADITDLVRTSYWSWKRPYSGPAAVLDKTGAWIASTASVAVAHGALTPTGPCARYIGPGYYKVAPFEWPHAWAPHPLGGAARPPAGADGIWVPAPRVQLLWQLARAKLIGEFAALDSWTCPQVARLDRWSDRVRDVRAAVIEQSGRGAEYDTVKDEFANCVTAMLGSRNAGQHNRVWKTKVQRPDWYHAIEDLTACTLFRWCWDLHDVATDAGRPELAPVGMRHVDELLVPAEAVELFTTHKRRGGRDPLRLDPRGITLGTFKIKGQETW
jgi:hypothetical protein